MPEPMSFRYPSGGDRASVRVARLAERQWGVVTHGQLGALGLGRRAIHGWVERGLIHPLYPAVFAVGHRALELEGRLTAALLYAGPGAALSHVTAAAWWGIRPTHPAVIHVSSPHRKHNKPGLLIHHPRHLEVVRHRRLPVTPVPQTLLDIAGGLPFPKLRRALAEAEFRKLVDLDTLDPVLGRGKPGSAALRRALRQHRPELARTRSDLEEDFVAFCEDHEIPIPRVNVTIWGLMVDALWPEHNLIVELDGGDAHGTRAQVHRDRTRDLTLRAAGYLVFRHSWAQISHEPTAVAADLRRALDL
jgi:very-short-patch-repair endonuclease